MLQFKFKFLTLILNCLFFRGTYSIQKIHYKSPLGESLLGHTVGEIVKVGSLDNYVEILSIAE